MATNSRMRILVLTTVAALLALSGLLGAAALRRRRRQVNSSQLLALCALLVACSESPASRSTGEASRWANLPQVTHPDLELQALGTREATLERLCARGRGDGFATALCNSGELPELADLQGLLQLSGLGETRVPMVVNLGGHWMIGLPVAYVLCFRQGWGVEGLWVGLTLGLMLVGAVLFVVWQRRSRRFGELSADPRGAS